MKFAIRGILFSLLVTAQSALAQPSRQPVVAVAQMDDLANSGQSAILTAMILSAIASTNKFRVIERGQMGKLLSEQALAKQGLTTSRNRGKVGGFEGADYLIYGSITALTASKKSDLASTLLIGGLTRDKNGQGSACYSGAVTLSLDIKITDKETGQIRYVKRLDEVQKSGTICGDGVPQANAAVLFRSAADKVAAGLVTTVYPVRIADVQPDGTVMLNYGEGSVKVGDVMAVFEPGKVVVDPDSGQTIGSSEIRRGLIQITDVQSRMSKGKITAGFDTPPQVRAIVRLATQDDVNAFKVKKKRN